ncbi:MAG: dTMP kinase [Candidatus Staskawiczbacteria bacterium]|nr:dTMP kinase [Candidatus Staskawiczbacteria bacterium]
MNGKVLFKKQKGGGFIVIEGLDGSGKNAQIELLLDYLRGKQVIATKEPTMESEAGRKIKQALREEIKLTPLELQSLYVQDRKEHLDNKVIPALKKGKFVLSNRYAFSTFAYGASDGLDLQLLIKMNEQFLLPDLTIIIDVLPESCMERIEGRGEPKELFEKKEKLVKVSEFYKKMPEMFKNVIMVNGEKAIPEVFKDIKKIIKKIL